MEFTVLVHYTAKQTLNGKLALPTSIAVHLPANPRAGLHFQKKPISLINLKLVGSTYLWNAFGHVYIFLVLAELVVMWLRQVSCYVAFWLSAVFFYRLFWIRALKNASLLRLGLDKWKCKTPPHHSQRECKRDLNQLQWLNHVLHWFHCWRWK